MRPHDIARGHDPKKTTGSKAEGAEIRDSVRELVVYPLDCNIG